MKRKLVPQGKGALTVTLPKKWIDKHNLDSASEVDIYEDENNLIVSSDSKIKKTKTSVKLQGDTVFAYRSIIGGLYRGGYDEIIVNLEKDSNLSNLQKAVDSLYGYEIFDVDKNKCIIKSIYEGTSTDIKSHILKMIHMINLMQDELLKNINTRNIDEIYTWRNNILKQRDIVIRLIHKEKLVSNNYLPFYTIALSLWNVARNYLIMYDNIIKKPTKQEINILKETIEYFKSSFSKLNLDLNDFSKRNDEYKILRKKIIQGLHKDSSIIISHCLNIALATQQADSSLYLLNHNP